MNELDQVTYIRGEEITKSVLRYRNVMQFLESDVPIEALCLPKVIENKLLRAGCLRISDVLHFDLGKIKGFGDKRIALLRSSINEFLSIGF